MECVRLRIKDEGFGEVYIPLALGRKYKNEAFETTWQYVFPSRKRSIGPRSGRERRHHAKRGCGRLIRACGL